jgi:hypothetical protein
MTGKMLFGIVLWLVFIQPGKVIAENENRSFSLPFHPKGQMFDGTDMVLTRSYVMNKTENSPFIQTPLSLLSKISSLEIKNGFDGGDFQLTFAVDNIRNKLVVFSREFDSDDISYLYDGCRFGSGELGLNNPLDVCAFGEHLVGGPYAERFVYSFFIADSGNGRIKRGLFTTNEIDVSGGRVVDHLDWYNDFESESLVYPTSVEWLYPASGFKLFAADPVNQKIVVFNNSGGVDFSIDAGDLGLAEFHPYSISLIDDGGGAYYLAILQREPGGGEVNPNLTIHHFNGSSFTLLSLDYVPEGTDIDSEEQLGFFVSTRQAEIYHYPKNGGQSRIQNISAQTLGGEVNCVSFNNGMIYCGLPYMDNSGILSLNYRWDIADVYSEKDYYFPEYEPLELHYTIASPSEHFIKLELADDGTFFDGLSGAPEGVGVHTFFTNISQSFSGELSLRLVVARNTPDGLQEVKSDPFVLSQGGDLISDIDVGKEEGYLYCDNDLIGVRFNINFVEGSDISVLYIKLDGRHGEWVPFYEGFECGRNSLQMTIPELYDEGPFPYSVLIEPHIGNDAYVFEWDGTFHAENCDPPPFIPPEIFESIEGMDQVNFSAGKDIALSRSSGSNILSFYYRGESASEVKIFDVRGRCWSRHMLEGSSNLKSVQVDGQNFPSGVYIAKVGAQLSGTIKFSIVN